MKKQLLAAGAVVVALGSGPQARATEMVSFSLSGGGISATGSITITPDTIAGDPAGAYNILGISGYFSDSNVGISNQAITGLIATDPNPANAPFATSLSRFDVPNASLLPAGDSDSLTYSNLFYPGGSPDTCDDGSAGGFLDVFGALLTLTNGDVVDVWSNGSPVSDPVPNDSAMYGVAVAGPVDQVETAIDYVGSGVTMAAPEPGSFWLLGTALLGVLGLSSWSRDRRHAAPAGG